MAETKKGIPLMNLNDVADITQVNRGFNKIDELLESHENKKIIDENGVHGLRYNEEDEELEYLDNKGNWESLTGVGGGAVANISPVKNIKVIKGNGTLKISWQDPEDLTWAGTKLVYKLGSYPQNPKDGNLVVDNTVKNQYKNNGVDVNALTNGSKYYFMFFPYDSKNKYSFDVENRVVGIPTDYKVMTVKIDLNNSNPETSCTYHDDAVGMTPGSEEWDDFFSYYPCLVQNGKEYGKLKKDDFTKFEDGSNADIENGTMGDVMICFPKIAWKIKKNENNIVTISLTKNPNPSEDFCFKSHIYNEKTFKKVYYGAYLSNTEYNSISSLSNKTIALGKQNQTNFTDELINKAMQKGENYQISSFYLETLLSIFFIIKFKNLDLFKVLGQYNSRQPENVTQFKTGYHNTTGMNYFNTSGKPEDRSKLFGLEDFCSLYYVVLGDVIIYQNALKMNIKKITTDLSKYNQNILTIQGEKSNYISSIYGENSKGFLADSFNGSQSTFFCSWQTLRDINKPERLMFRNGGVNGVINIALNLNSGNIWNYFTARLTCYSEEVTE